MPTSRVRIAIGPVKPGWGSWEWVGSFLLEQLGGVYSVSPFSAGEMPVADAVVVIKHAPPAEWAHRVADQSALIYCPIDFYDGAEEIVADAEWLRRCAGVLVHCRRLEPYFSVYANTSYLDHPLRYETPTRAHFRDAGDLLWVGVRSNLTPLVNWVNAHPLPHPLDVLTNPETPGRMPTPAEFGFRGDRAVRMHEWTPDLHKTMTAAARAVLDVKGDDFRSRHKPPAKALDFVASGLPIAFNPGSSPSEHLLALGLKVPSPQDLDRWLSEEYWKEIRRVGQRLSRELAPEKVGARARRLIDESLENHRIRKQALPSIREPVFQNTQASPQERYARATEDAATGRVTEARTALRELDDEGVPAPLRALARNDLAVLDAQSGNLDAARAGFHAALEIDKECESARQNLIALGDSADRSPPITDQLRIAVVSLLFNWPSTGGGNVHSAELTKSLAEAGYSVRHFFARYEPWGIGRVAESIPYPAEGIEFTEAGWTSGNIVEKFREAIEGFDADWVILTDSWNMKPLLAEAAAGRRYILRLQALECLCPLNNVRLLPEVNGGIRQCTRHQLATPDECARCVRVMDHTSGDLHRAERSLAGVGNPAYKETLYRAFAEAAAVFAVNPLTAAMVEPYAQVVRVVTSGMDPQRFPWPPPLRDAAQKTGRLSILFAGLTREWMKGFHILRDVCQRLWSNRRDFEVVITDAAEGAVEPWARYVGWQTQGDLPKHFYSADIVVVPTVAQEALGRTAVEAMAAGKPVVASRLGGLPFTVIDGATGLLSEPGDAIDLGVKLTMLLDDRELRDRLGLGGRRRFEEHYTWPVIIERHYRPLFGAPLRTV